MVQTVGDGGPSYRGITGTATRVILPGRLRKPKAVKTLGKLKNAKKRAMVMPAKRKRKMKGS